MAEHPEHLVLNRAIARLRKIGDIIISVENRCMAVDGPVTPTTEEMTEDELREIWQQVRPYMPEVNNDG